MNMTSPPLHHQKTRKYTTLHKNKQMTALADVKKRTVLDEFTQYDPNQKRRSGDRMKLVLENVEERRDATPAMAGIIKKIKLSNFMCHGNFEIELGPQINFIVGRNGSGKSVILTALSVGLGAKANETSRGNSLKSLIKHGESAARITISFKNCGPLAYQPDVYGNEVIVQRVIKDDGISSYAIRSADFKVISTRKKDLDDILTHYGISVGNPMTILTQDHAKTFINTASDSEVFKYFMAGTRLDEAMSNYDETAAQLRATKSKIKSHFPVVARLKEDHQKAIAKYKQYQTQDQVRNNQKLLHGKCVWFEAYRREQSVKELERKIQEWTDQIGKAEQDIRETSLTEEDRKLKVSELVNAVVSAQAAKDQATVEAEECAVSLSKQNSRIGVLEEDKEGVAKQLKKAEKERDQLDKDIEQERSRLDKINGVTHEELETRIANLEKEKSTCKKNEILLVNENREKQSAFEVHTRQRDTLLKQLVSEKNNWQVIQSNVLKTRGNRFLAFGQETQQVVQGINSEKSFHHAVKGPVGLEVKLKKEYERVWSPLLEAMLAKTLTSYVAQDYHDQKLLSSILHRNRCFKDVTTRREEIFQFSRPQNVLTVLDVLEFSSEATKCLLVDLNNIHRTVLCETQEEAKSILRSRNDVAQVLIPLNQSSGIKMFGKSINTDPVRYLPEASRLGASDEESLASAHRNVARIEGDIARLRSEKVDFQKEVRFTVEQNDKEILKLKKSARDLGEQIFQAKTTMEQNDSSTGTLESLKEEREKVSNQILLLEESIRAIDGELQSCSELLQKAGVVAEEKRDKVMACKKRLTVCELSQSEFSSSIEKIEKDLEHYKRSITKRENQILDCSEHMIRLQSEIKEYSTKAQRYCSRDEITLGEEDTRESIEREVDAVESQIRHLEESLGMSGDQIKSNLIATRERFHKAKEEFENAQTLRESLKRSLFQRKVHTKNMREATCLQVNASFEESLSLRGFTGELVFDFEKQELSMMVSTKRNDTSLTARILSGGEKSFAQIALLLAIWKPMGSLVRGLDEFDVFMDTVTRRLSLKLIMSKVRQNPKTQTIFITPHELANVKEVEGNDVFIRRIASARPEPSEGAGDDS